MLVTKKQLLTAIAALTLILCVVSFCKTDGNARAQDAGKTGKKKNKGKLPKVGEQDAQTDRDAIAKRMQSLVAAFEKGDAKALAAHWTEAGEYLADDGTVFRGRAEIEKEYARLFAKKSPDTKIDVDTDSIRFPSKDTAIEEGYLKVRHGKDTPVVSKYSVLHVREGGQWLMAVVREWPSEGVSLRELDWLIGTWKAKRDDTEVQTTYEWWGDKKAFIRVQISLTQKDRTTKGFQMITRDAATGHLRSWTFDPDGSFGEATWSRDGKKWLLDSAGVLADGTVMSATNIITRVDNEAFTFQSVERMHGGEEAPDIGPIRETRIKNKE